MDNCIKKLGGKSEVGWVFWNISDIAIESEAHSVWITNSGKRIDVTPRPYFFGKSLLFVIDSNVYKKRGYTAQFNKCFTDDIYIKSIIDFRNKISKIQDKSFIGMGEEMILNLDDIRYEAKQLGLIDKILIDKIIEESIGMRV